MNPAKMSPETMMMTMSSRDRDTPSFVPRVPTGTMSQLGQVSQLGQTHLALSLVSQLGGTTPPYYIGGKCPCPCGCVSGWDDEHSLCSSSTHAETETIAWAKTKKKKEVKKMKIEFFAPMKNPPKVTSQQKGINWETRRVYTKDTLREARAVIASAFAKHRPEKPITGPVACELFWVFPYFAKDIGKDGETEGNIPHADKPDIDNILKLPFDVMSDLGFWADDKTVVDLRVRKARGPVTGVYVFVTAVEW
jgi:Holliday junction resolvase RusA-like endonuclease